MFLKQHWQFQDPGRGEKRDGWIKCLLFPVNSHTSLSQKKELGPRELVFEVGVGAGQPAGQPAGRVKTLLTRRGSRNLQFLLCRVCWTRHFDPGQPGPDFFLPARTPSSKDTSFEKASTGAKVGSIVELSGHQKEKKVPSSVVKNGPSGLGLDRVVCIFVISFSLVPRL